MEQIFLIVILLYIALCPDGIVDIYCEEENAESIGHKVIMFL